jgi:hypothetical protein
MASQGPVSDADRRLALGDTTPLPVPRREPDVLVDSLASDGTAAHVRGGDSPTGASGGR